MTNEERYKDEIAKANEDGGFKMTNAEKYRDEIWDITMKGYPFAINQNNSKLVPCDGSVSCVNCVFDGCPPCAKARREWLNSECKGPEIDWSKVAVDTPILVKDYKSDNWLRRHFAKYEGGLVYAWTGGITSWTSATNGKTFWAYAKLAEEEQK